MKDLVVTSWCDLCFATDQSRVPAASSAIACSVVDAEFTAMLRELDVCDAHAKELHDLGLLINKMGVPLDTPAAKPTRANYTRGDCPVCGQEMTASYVTAHIWARHIGQPKPVVSAVCPDCGQDFKSGRVAAAHRANLHNYDARAEAVAVLASMKPRRPSKGA